MDIAGKKVTIIGGKRSGMALARLVIRLNGEVQLSEQDNESCLPRKFKSWAAQHNVAFEILQGIMQQKNITFFSKLFRVDNVSCIILQ